MVNAVCIIAYTPAAIAMAVYTYQWTVPIAPEIMPTAQQPHYRNQQLNSPEYEKWVSQYVLNFILPVAFTCVSSYKNSKTEFHGDNPVGFYFCIHTVFHRDGDTPCSDKDMCSAAAVQRALHGHFKTDCCP